MKFSAAITLAFMAAGSGTLCAGQIASTGFEGFTVATNLTDNGWMTVPFSPSNAGAGNYQVIASTGVNTSGTAVQNIGTDGQIGKVFDSRAAIPAGTTSFYLSFWIRPYSNGTANNGATLCGATPVEGGTAADAIAGPTFGISGDTTNGLRFSIRPINTSTTYYSAESINANDWYQVCLQITVASTISASKGTLWVRNISAGETALHAVSDLTDINLRFTNSTHNPENYTTWRMRSNHFASFDNLEFGTGALAVPEPAGLGLAAMSIVPLLSLKKNRKR